MISLDQVKAGISFYRLEALSDRILTCADALNGSAFLPLFEKRLRELYEDTPEVLKTLYEYHTPDDLFAQGIFCDAPLVAAALGGTYHQKNIRKYRFDEVQIEKQRMRMKNYIIYMAEGNNTTVLPWSANMARGILIEVGVLQFQLGEEADRRVVYIHIPGDGVFSEDNIRAAIKESRPLVRRYYGLDAPEYLCNSWLLSPEVHAIMGKNSNIYRFYELFEVKPGGDCKNGIRWNVFGTNDPMDELKEETSLQRSIKKAFSEGIVFHIGMGRLK